MMTDGCNSWRGHRWSRWSEQEPFDVDNGKVQFRQRRQCERCGMDQVYVVIRLVAPDTAER